MFVDEKTKLQWKIKAGIQPSNRPWDQGGKNFTRNHYV